MSAKFGRAREFDPTSEDWESYAEQMKHYLFANDVKEAKKVPVLLSTCGTATYSLIKSLCSPDSLRFKIVRGHCQVGPGPLQATSFSDHGAS